MGFVPQNKGLRLWWMGRLGRGLRNEANFGRVMRGGLLGEPETKPTRPQKRRRILRLNSDRAPQAYLKILSKVS